jgi:uncharacterized membrane protein YukC
MIKPKLTNFADFIEKPKPVIPKTKYQVQKEINWRLNILLFMVICIGLYYLYKKYKEKEQHQIETIQKLKEFDNYLQEKIINDMVDINNNNNNR